MPYPLYYSIWLEAIVQKLIKIFKINIVFIKLRMVFNINKNNSINVVNVFCFFIDSYFIKHIITMNFIDTIINE